MIRLQCTECSKRCVKSFERNYTKTDIKCAHGLIAKFKAMFLKPMVKNYGKVRHV